MCYNSLKGKLENPAIGIDVLGVINPNNIDDCVIEDSNGLKQTWQWPPEAAAFGFWNKRSSPNSCDPTPHETRNFEKTKWEEKDAVLQHSKSKLPILIASTFWQLLFVIFRLQQEIYNVIPFSTLQFSPRKVTQQRYLKRNPLHSRNGVRKFNTSKLFELDSCTIKKEVHLKIATPMKHSTTPFSSPSKRMVKE